MARVGIILRLTHTGKAGESVLISDIGDGTDTGSYRKTGAVYVPRGDPEGGNPGYVDLTYSTDVALSFRDRGIRKFIEGEYLEAEFFFGPYAQRGATGTVRLTESPYTVRPDDRYIYWCPSTPGPLTLTLPKVTEHQTGKIEIVDVTGIAGTHTITVLPDGTVPDTINGGPSETITTNYGSLDLHHDCVSDWTNIGAGGGGGVTDHTALTSLDWAGSDHTGTANTIAGFDGTGAAVYYPIPGGGRTDYGSLATDPAGVPSGGDKYYNTSLQMEMRYDSLRSKWLSVETTEFIFGRNFGGVAPGQYYRTVDGRVMSAALGWYAVRSGTIVSLGYTRGDSDAATFELTANGTSIATVASSATSGRDITLNADFTFGQILAARNQLGGNSTSDVVAWIRVKWRV